jgi:hypothetical protein
MLSPLLAKPVFLAMISSPWFQLQANVSTEVHCMMEPDFRKQQFLLLGDQEIALLCRYSLLPVSKERAMADRRSSSEDSPKNSNLQEVFQEEVDEVLTTLRRLHQKVSSPIILACLEAARADIAYLADTADDSVADAEEDLDLPGEEAAAA